MKELIYTFLIVSLLACAKKPARSTGSDVTSTPGTSSAKLLILKVDYTNRIFEGGQEINLTGAIINCDSIPLKKEYQSPGDFGNLRLLYLFTNDTIFDGSIIWSGHGRMRLPKTLNPPNSFLVLNNKIVMPDSSRLQNLHFTYPASRDSIPWSAISNLDIVKQYLKYNKKVGYFLYTPSVGMGNPAEWDWFFILSH